MPRWRGRFAARAAAQRFRWVKAPLSAELTHLADTIARQVGRCLARQGLLERDAENSWLTGEDLDNDPMSNVLGHSITAA